MSLDQLPGDLIKLIAVNYLHGYDSINLLSISKKFYQVRITKFGEFQWLKFQYKVICEIIQNKQIQYLDKYGQINGIKKLKRCQFCATYVKLGKHIQHERKCKLNLARGGSCEGCYKFVNEMRHLVNCRFLNECAKCRAPFPNFLHKGTDSNPHYHAYKTTCNAQFLFDKIINEIIKLN